MKTLRSYAFFYAPIIGSASCAYACVEVINKPSKSPLNVASECGRISVELGGGGREKYGQPKNYATLYFSVAYAT